MAYNNREKEKFFEILEEAPFITLACKKIGINRATAYRWMKDNPEFKKKVLDASIRGHKNLVDIAEMALLAKIKDGYFPAIKYFLEHNKKRYQISGYDYVKKQEKSSESKKKIDISPFLAPDGKHILVSKQMKEELEKEE